MENLTPEQISSLSSEELSTKLLECVQHFKEQAKQLAEIVSEYEQTLVQIDDGIKEARRALAKAPDLVLRLIVQHNLDELLASRRKVKAGLDTSRAALKDARQTVRDTRDSKSARKWMQRQEQEESRKKK